MNSSLHSFPGKSIPSYRLATIATAFLLVTNGFLEFSMSSALNVLNLRFCSTSSAISARSLSLGTSTRLRPAISIS
jgi:hypothetical protein